MIRIICVALACLLFSSSAEARHRHPAAIVAHPDCNILWPCEGVTTSPRGERIVKAMGGFGSAQKIYKPRTAHRTVTRLHTVPLPHAKPAWHEAARIVEHPAGCPRVAFCACGTAVRLLGNAHAAPWLARAWYAFRHTTAAPHMAGVRPHHVIALEYQVSGNMWMVYDANSGGHATRMHVIDISRYTIVNPRAG